MMKILLMIACTFSLPLWAQAQVSTVQEVFPAKSAEVIITPTLLATPVTRKRTSDRTPAEAKASQAAREFYAKKMLKTEGEILLTAGTVHEFRAGEAIELSPGFEVNGNTEFSAEIVEVPAEEETTGAMTFAEPEVNSPTLASAFTLFPNPVVEQLFIRYELTEEAPVGITLCTLTGTVLQVLRPVEMQAAGAYEVTFDVTAMPTGVYFVSLQIGEQGRTQRIIVQ